MGERVAWFRLPVPAQDLLLALFVTVMQVQGTLARGAEEGERQGWRHCRRSSPVAGTRIRHRRGFQLGLLQPRLPGRARLAGVFVALYTLAAYGDGRRSLVIAGVGISVLATGWLVAAADIEPRAAIGWVFFRIGASVMSAALGESVRSRRVIAAEAQERAELAERTRDEEARARVDAERLRIAREVHDTVAHAIAIINVQSGVTAHVLDKRPERAREALRDIEQTSSRALREMRAILGVPRDDSDGRAPHPGLAQLDELTAKARDAGLDITVDASSPAAPLPTAVDNAAYRILQESITNVIRHVGPTRVTVTLNPGSDVRVADDGCRAGDCAVRARPHVSGNGSSADPGRGILGMREHCQLLGGELYAGPISGGGFEVHARLPLAPTEARP